ncbi:helix-turn-helix transcriptional regulator [Psychromonas sp.]|uniref:helix-turn-helix transcriptional regulator n=1 Tax=Psychromonas sp. TaxID=1884585 RepID=UPI003567DF8D
MNAEQFAHLLELLHANTFTKENFTPMLDELRKLTNSGIALLVKNAQEKSIELSLSDANSGSRELMEQYAYDLAQGLHCHYACQFPHGKLVKLSCEVCKKIRAEHPSENYKHLDSRYICGACINTTQSRLAFAVNRGRHKGNYTIDEVQLLHHLIPHVKVAFENRQHLSFLQNSMDNISQALESSAEALGIIDRNGKLLHCTPVFYGRLLKYNLLVADMGRLQFRSYHQQNWLEQTINKVVNNGSHQRHNLRLCSEPLIELQLTMLKQVDGEGIFLLALKIADDILQWWRLVYNFTPKEQLLIEKLLTGLTLPEIAEQLQISHNTVRTHLKHILSKVDCSSQNQLLVTLLSSR